MARRAPASATKEDLRELQANLARRIDEVEKRLEARVAFRLKNLTAGPLRVVGAKADCACMAFDDLPLAIEPGKWGKMTVRFVPREAEVGQVVEHSVLLYLDASSVPVVLRAQAEVVPPEPRAVGGT